jgi:hypothetical protein
MASVEAEPCKDNGAVIFKNKFVDNLLMPYMIAPSKMKKTILSELGEEINIKFEKVATFLTYDFLSEDNPFQSKLKALVSQNLSTLKLIEETERFDCTFFDLLGKGKLNDALAHIYRYDFAFVLLPSDQQKKYVINPYYSSKKLFNTSRLAKFAFYVVDKKLLKQTIDSGEQESSDEENVSITYDRENLVGRWSTNFEAIEETFDKLKAGFFGYKNWLGARAKWKKKRPRWRVLLGHIGCNWLEKSCIRSLIQSDFERVDDYLDSILYDGDSSGLCTYQAEESESEEIESEESDSEESESGE